MTGEKKRRGGTRGTVGVRYRVGVVCPIYTVSPSAEIPAAKADNFGPTSTGGQTPGSAMKSKTKNGVKWPLEGQRMENAPYWTSNIWESS